MAIGGAFLGGGVEVVPAGSCKLELEILTEDRKNLTATFTIKGTSTYTVTAGADGRAVYTVPSGQTYTVSVNTTGYDNIASQTVVAESGTVRYVRFEAFAGRVKRSGDTMSGFLELIYNFPVIRLKSTELAYSDPVGESTTVFALMMNDKNDTFMGGLFNRWYSNGDRKIYLENKGKDGKMGQISLWTNASGVYAEAPTPSDKTDNSTKIATTAWINTADCIVHRYNAETILGLKTFKDPIHLVNDSVSYTQSQDASTWTYLRGIEFRDKASERMGEIRSVRYTNTVGVLVNSTEIIARGKDNVDTLLAIVTADNGQKYAYCPSTPSNATNNMIATADWTLGKFVKKTGDTMTGPLNIQMVLPQAYLKHTKDDYTVAHTDSTPATLKFLGYQDKNGKDTFHISEYVYNGGRGLSITLSDASSGSVKSTNLGLIVEKTGGTYATVPTPSSKQDNSVKIATTAWVNQADFLVHSYGNETVAGKKTFTGNMILDYNNGGVQYNTIVNASKELYGISSFNNTSNIHTLRTPQGTVIRLNCRNKNSRWITLDIINPDDGDPYCEIPSTPSTATANEIATANWVNTKLAQKSKVTAVTSYTQLIELIKNGKRGDSFGLTMDYTAGSFGDIVITAEAVEIHAFGHYTLEELTVTDGNLSSFQAFGSGEVSGTFFKDDSSTYIYATTGFGRSKILQGYADALRVVEDGKLTYFLTDGENTTSFDGYYISI